MTMKKLLTRLFTFISCLLINFAGMAQRENHITSMGKLSLEFRLSDTGTPLYAIRFDQRPVIKWSSLGFSLETDTTFYKGFELLASERRSADKTWQPVWGEVKNIRDHYQEIKYHLRQKKTPGLLLDIVFRVFDDGVGFRYEFPKQPGLKYFVVKDEFTQFNLAGDHK